MSRSLLRNLREVEARIAKASSVALFSDFDGTLTPLVRDPAAPRLDERTREILDRISRSDRAILSFVSGRALQDLYSRIELKEAIYAGNHGLEICGRQLSFVEPTAAAAQDRLHALAAQLANELRQFAGVLVQDKGLTASVHYRAAEERAIPAIETAVQVAIASAGGTFRLTEGNKVFEILPPTDWNKGKAVRWILEHTGDGDQLSIYLGDDRTDEDAFRALPNGITVRVGEFTDTSARFDVAGPPDVQRFLVWLAEQLS